MAGHECVAHQFPLRGSAGSTKSFETVYSIFPKTKLSDRMIQSLVTLQRLCAFQAISTFEHLASYTH
jgi:hypothetical protein